MASPAVLLVHQDPVVLELVSGTLGDEFEFVSARSVQAAQRAAAGRAVAVVIVDATSDADAALELVQGLRARDPHVQAIFFADVRDTGSAWRLADFGAVVPRNYDLDRLRIAVRKSARLSAMSSGAEKLKLGLDPLSSDKTTRRLVGPRRTESQSNVATARISYAKPPGGPSAEARRKKSD